MLCKVQLTTFNSVSGPDRRCCRSCFDVVFNTEVFPVFPVCGCPLLVFLLLFLSFLLEYCYYFQMTANNNDHYVVRREGEDCWFRAEDCQHQNFDFPTTNHHKWFLCTNKSVGRFSLKFCRELVKVDVGGVVRPEFPDYLQFLESQARELLQPCIKDRNIILEKDLF